MSVLKFCGGAGMILALALFIAGDPAPADAQSGCMSPSQARSSGMLGNRNLRPLGQIKRAVERSHKGRVVSVAICRRGGGIVYRLSVLQPNGNVVTITEPAQ